jgi:hypothetical protein
MNTIVSSNINLWKNNWQSRTFCFWFVLNKKNFSFFVILYFNILIKRKLAFCRSCSIALESFFLSHSPACHAENCRIFMSSFFINQSHNQENIDRLNLIFGIKLSKKKRIFWFEFEHKKKTSVKIGFLIYERKSELLT